MDGHKTQANNLKTRYHHKPYLVRHLSLLVIAAWLVFVGILGLTLGTLPTGQTHEVLSVVSTINAATAPFSSDWVSFAYDPNRLSIMSRADYVQLSPGQTSDLAQASVRLTIQPRPSQASANNLAPRKVLLSSSDDQIAGVGFRKNIYEQSVVLGNKNYKVYSIEWDGQNRTMPISLKLEGLQAKNMMPATFQAVLNTLSFAPNGRVLAAKQTVPASYVADSVSPAVVKIYRVTCGTLVVDNQEVGGERCDASAGSGFFVSSEGYIATSGHVVAREAEEVLVDLLLNNPVSLSNFLKYMGLSENQVAAMRDRPELLAAVIAGLYDIPNNTIRLNNKHSVLLVSLGGRALAIDSEQDVKNLLHLKDTDTVKRASLTGIDYSPKDLFVLASGNEEGFSTSDVALIKIDANNTPYLKIYDGQVTQNMKITVIGFPGDADNILTDNKSLSVTATNGSISAIRVAAGSRYRLFQSDADASQGNSGGPVIDEAGEALGLLTYRYKNEEASDAAKSYIRDIADLEDLAHENDVVLGRGGTTQNSWEHGLQLFSENRFSKAIREFEAVKDAYPAHRLVNSYLAAAKEGIVAGHDVRDVPFAMAAGASFIGAFGASGTIIIMARHNAKHLSYKLATTNKMYRPHHANS